MDLLFSALLIFGMRVADVTLGTLRIVSIVRGRRSAAGVLAFFESLIWLLAAAQVFTSLDAPLKIVGFAAGYAAGTVLGSTVERWLALGTALIRVVAPIDSPPVYEVLHDRGYPATVVNGEGREGEVRVLFSIVPRRQTRHILDIIADVNPEAFVTIEEAHMPDMAVRRAAAVRK